MRVLVVLLALAAMPLGVSVSQESARRVPEDLSGVRPFSDPKMCGRHLTGIVKSSANAKVPAALPVHGGIHGVLDLPCASETPPLPPPPLGTVRIKGGVFDGMTWVALPSWPVNLIGTANRSTTTLADGSYAFEGLPPGSYTICVELLGGTQTMPLFPGVGTACPSGFGYEYTLLDGEESTWNNFAVVR